ncbi:acyl transferase/acyl hydrolase/lysophospholipase [Leptodontidium sp. MPI-SDFR-AT-0119]|nr:acyl transferase/acyl hydrolase/lysophospholipase [Leptodontidium sp. MPI-SDFR-AT-0119]
MSDSAAAITVRNMSTVGASGPPRRLLSLDGGGVKGMAILLILKRLFRTIQRDEHLPEMPRPCDYFDLIGGTSTGGIIAIMLGRLRMSIDDCIQVFRHISETVFKQNPSWFARVRGALLTGQPFFEAGRLEEAIRDVLTARGFGEDDKLYEADNSNCKVFVSTTRARTVHAVLLRSYITSKPSEENYNCTIWEAARATSAAPLFFEPTQLSSDVSQATFVDGALHLNNPIAKVINEAEYIWPTAAFKSIVSIGTGWIRVTGLNNSNLRLHHVVQTCVDLALNCHNEAEKFVGDRKGKELSEAGVYHRFDVDWGMDSVALDNWHKMDDIDAFTQEYLGRQESELEKCSRSLCTEELAPQDIQISEFISTLPRHSSTSNSNRIFSGRETELSNIRTLMESSPRTHQSVCLHGLGGIG